MRKLLLALLACFALFATAASGQSAKGRVSGKVLDPYAKPVVGATVMIKGTFTGTATGTDGSFTIDVPANGILVASSIGYITEEVAVNGKTVVNISLKEQTEEIDDVVIVGYSIIPKTNLTGSVSVIDPSKTVASRSVADLSRGLQGVTPGLDVITSSGNLGVAPQIYIRGQIGSLNADAQPLILVDNIEVPDMMAINPQDVESITVLKDASSSAIYGTRGAFGVVLITTKKGKKGQKGATVSYSGNFAWSAPVNTPQIADGADAAEFLLKSARRTAPSAASYNILGAYYDDLSIERMRQWKQIYGGMNLGDEMVAGRDYEYRNGAMYYYRPWNVDEVFLNSASPQQRNDISVSGATDKSSYYGSISYLNQTGLVNITPKPDRLQRFTTRARFDTEINKYVKAGFNLSSTNQYRDTPNFRLANASQGANEYWFNVYRYPETYPYGYVDGMPLKSIRTELEQANMNSDDYVRSTMQATLTITPVKNFNIDLMYGYYQTNSHYKIAATPITGVNQWLATTNLKNVENSFFVDQNYLRENSYKSGTHTGSATANYKYKNGKHLLVALGGMDFDYNQNQSNYSERSGLLFPSQPEFALTDGENIVVSGGHGHSSSLRFLGSVDYTFDNKYLLRASINANAASNFPPKYKWGYFPSVSAGWVVSKERFMSAPRLQNILSFLKIRAAYGSVGNARVGHQYLAMMSSSLSNWYIGTTNQRAFSGPTIPAENMTWETLSSYNAGLEAKLFKNAIEIEFEYYKAITSQIVTKGSTVPNSLGTTPPARNYGEITKNGFEATVAYNKIFENGLSLRVKASIDDQYATITKFSDLYRDGIRNGTTENYQGKRMGEIWGYVTDRLFTESDFSGNDGNANPTWYYAPGVPNQDKLNTASAFHYGPGDVKYMDINGDGEVNYGSGTTDDSGDMKVIGNSLPRYKYGFDVTVSWKGFDARVFVMGVGKADYWATGAVFIPNFTNNEALYQNQMDYWTPQRPNAFYPAPSNPGANNHNANWQPQTRYLLNMAYARLKTVTLGYSLPQKWIGKVGLSKARVYVNGENLLTFDHLKGVSIDPEVRQNSVEGFTDAKSYGRTYPYFRTWAFGVDLTF